MVPICVRSCGDFSGGSHTKTTNIQSTSHTENQKRKTKKRTEMMESLDGRKIEDYIWYITHILRNTEGGDRWAEREYKRDKKHSVTHRRFSAGFYSFVSKILFIIFNIERFLGTLHRQAIRRGKEWDSRDEIVEINIPK